jgi:hypothetical protein
MSNWYNQPSETRTLLNPAFTSIVIYSFVEEYKKIKKTEPTLLELYLVLPIVLHNDTRILIPPRFRKK